MQERLLLLLLCLKQSFASRALPRTPMGELTTLTHTPLSTGESDPPQIPPNSAPSSPRFPRSTEGAFMPPPPHFLTVITPLRVSQTAILHKLIINSLQYAVFDEDGHNSAHKTFYYSAQWKIDTYRLILHVGRRAIVRRNKVLLNV